MKQILKKEPRLSLKWSESVILSVIRENEIWKKKVIFIFTSCSSIERMTIEGKIKKPVPKVRDSIKLSKTSNIIKKLIKLRNTQILSPFVCTINTQKSINSCNYFLSFNIDLFLVLYIHFYVSKKQLEI